MLFSGEFGCGTKKKNEHDCSDQSPHEAPGVESARSTGAGDHLSGRRSDLCYRHERRVMNPTGLKEQQQRKIKTQSGFIAALDQSGGSTPKALRAYGIKEDAWANEEQMFALVHQMRARIITSPSFNGDRILAAILFEGTMDRDIEGQPT